MDLLNAIQHPNILIRIFIWLLSVVTAGVAVTGFSQDAPLSPAPRRLEPIVVPLPQPRNDLNRESKFNSHKQTTIHVDRSKQQNMVHALRDNPVLQLDERGAIGPFLTNAPRFRGHDAKSSEIYLNDMVLHDPFSNLPLVEQIDLESFSQININQGLNDAAIPSLNHAGNIQLLTGEAKGSSLSLSTGKPYYLTTRLKSAYESKWSDHKNIHFQIYLRHHQSPGLFEYYSDEGTPFNTEDDKLKQRENNDTGSYVLMPLLKITTKKYSLQLLGNLYDKRQGIPALSSNKASYARQQSQAQLLGFTYQHYIQPEHQFLPTTIMTSWLHSQNSLTTHDPEQSILGPQATGTLKTTSLQGHVKASWQGPLSLYIDHAFGQSHISNHPTAGALFKVQRTNHAPYLGVKWHHQLDKAHQLTLQLKGKLSWAQDKILDGERAHQPLDHLRNYRSQNIGISLALENKPFWNVYLQSSSQERLPSLMETFGDGGMVLPSLDLKTETIKHLEVGLEWRKPFAPTLTFSLSQAIFKDLISNQIVLSNSIGDSLKASNIAQSRIQGTETGVSLAYRPSSNYSTKGNAVYLYLQPYDLTGSRRSYLLPRTPEKQAMISLEQTMHDVLFTIKERYRSQAYRDRANQLPIAAYSLTDLSIAYYKKNRVENGAGSTTTKAGSGMVDRLINNFKVDLSVLNVFDKKSNDFHISSDTQTLRGRTAIGDYAGYPIPARQWLLSLQARW